MQAEIATVEVGRALALDDVSRELVELRGSTRKLHRRLPLPPNSAKLRRPATSTESAYPAISLGGFWLPI